MSISKLTDYTVPLIFIAIAPIFSLFELNQKGEIHIRQLMIGSFLSLSLGFIAAQLLSGEINDVSPVATILFAFIVSLSYLIFWFTNRYAKNKIGYFTIVIYWLAMEYTTLYITYLPSDLLIGVRWKELAPYAGWMKESGWLGLSLWILVGNILFYYALFYNQAILKGQVRWVTIIYSIVIVSIPVIVNYFMNIESVVVKEVVVEREYLGRTALLFSVLLVCYAFVKRQVRQ